MQTGKGIFAHVFFVTVINFNFLFFSFRYLSQCMQTIIVIWVVPSRIESPRIDWPAFCLKRSCSSLSFASYGRWERGLSLNLKFPILKQLNHNWQMVTLRARLSSIRQAITFVLVVDIWIMKRIMSNMHLFRPIAERSKSPLPTVVTKWNNRLRARQLKRHPEEFQLDTISWSHASAICGLQREFSTQPNMYIHIWLTQ